MILRTQNRWGDSSSIDPTKQAKKWNKNLGDL